MRSIAAQAGCSVMTVSRALSGHPHVQPKLRARIEALARTVDYRPNPVLSALNSYRTRVRQHKDLSVLAFVTDWKTEAGWRAYQHNRSLFDGAARRSSALGFRLETFWIRAFGLRAGRLEQILYNRGIRGLLLPPVHSNLGRLRLDWSRFSTVAVGYSLVSPQTHFVVTDYFQGAIIAWRKLRQMGYRRIGLAIGRRHESRTRHRWHSAVLGLQEGLPAAERVAALVEEPDWTGRARPMIPQSVERESFHRWFRREKPDAVMSLGPGIAGWIRELGLRVPEDVGVAHLDLETPDCGLSGIFQHPELIGAAAVDLLNLLLQRFETGLPAVPQGIVVAPTWMEGGTASRRSTEGVSLRQRGAVRTVSPSIHDPATRVTSDTGGRPARLK